MSVRDMLQILVYFALLLASVPLLGAYMAKVYTGEPTWLTPILRPIEVGCYRLSGVDPKAAMNWKGYAVALLLFTVIGFAALFALQMLQAMLPLNPAGRPAVDLLLAFNTAGQPRVEVVLLSRNSTSTRRSPSIARRVHAVS